MKIPWIQNTKNEPSASLTFTVIAFVVVTLWLVGWLVGAALELPVPQFDVGTAMGYLIPFMSLYFGRRWTLDRDKATSEGEGERYEGEGEKYKK